MYNIFSATTRWIFKAKKATVVNPAKQCFIRSVKKYNISHAVMKCADFHRNVGKTDREMENNKLAKDL